jgi:hypothetical protein
MRLIPEILKHLREENVAGAWRCIPCLDFRTAAECVRHIWWKPAGNVL